MKMAYTSINYTQIHLIKGLLENNGIACLLMNENMNAVAGEIPHTNCYIELWVKNDTDDQIAKEIIENFNQTIKTKKSDPWTCENCNQTIEPQFDTCWNCGTNKATSNNKF